MSINSQLQTIYPSMIVAKPEEMNKPADYLWYQTHTGEIIGILKDDVEKRDTDILNVFLQPLIVENATETAREKSWMDFLERKKTNLSLDPPLKYRFVFFSIAELPADRDSFQDAFQSLFPRRMPLVWVTDTSGLIIEEIMTSEQETLSFEEIIDVLMSDFYTKIRFYLSEFSTDIQEAPAIYDWSKKCHHVAEKYRFASVITYNDLLPYLYLDALPKDDWNNIHRIFFKGMDGDKDLLHTIKVFLESGSNATLASKQLYMHRNSLQYRVDKFIERTGIDIKRFDQAIITYLALLKLDS
ncbi:PucR family transcriptional regulator [Halobacillus yeomjeoni]|uniref:Helix-turn-helix domain-containing protein n=1 Tax=Halobacillus yeomjeoni TaxID=311194 RepID=A0A931MTR5_9BACI|nr:helix-turn-helix domain-containing protein [Halobacillus yeomjeoni]MBH0228690.1 helix-turn-helix domain-containing protein [Halobacillus yeomjeoni]